MSTTRFNDFLVRHWHDIVWILIILVLMMLGIVVLKRSIRKRFGAVPRMATILRKVHVALVAVILVSGLRLMLVRLALDDQDLNVFLGHVLDLAFIATVAWLLIEIVFAAEHLLLLRYVAERDTSDVRVRKVDTQVRLISHLTVAGIIVVAIGVMLLTFPAVRLVGGSLIASAGVVSVIGGLAARTALANLFAGIQIALSDSIRVGDIIQIGSDSGTVDEITLTYVVVDLWDERRLMVPSDYFLTNKFQNWTRKGNEISALILVDIDWTVPVDGVEAMVRDTIARSHLWDKRLFQFRIKTISNGLVTLRIVVSTDSAQNMFQIEGVVNKAIVEYITSQPQGQGLPRIRTEGVGTVPLQLQQVDHAAAPAPLKPAPPVALDGIDSGGDDADGGSGGGDGAS